MRVWGTGDAFPAEPVRPDFPDAMVAHSHLELDNIVTS